VKKSRKLRGIGLGLLILGGLTTGCSYLPKGRADFEVRVKEQGIASWYGDSFHGQLTANGETYDEGALTGAHRTLPFGTVVKVTNAANGLQIRIRINDRGPYISGRILDMSYAAATELELVDTGIAPVSLEVIGVERERPPLIDLPGTWRALGALIRKTDLREMEDAPAVRSHLPAHPLSANLRALATPSRRRSPWDLALERRLRREADSRASDLGEEGNAEMELS